MTRKIVRYDGEHDDNEIMSPYDEHHPRCECERCAGQKSLLRHRPNDALFDGDPL